MRREILQPHFTHHLKEKSSTMSSMSSFNEASVAAIAKRKAEEQEKSEFDAQLASRISSYNHVVRNTAVKFNGTPGLVSAVLHQLLIPAKSELVSVSSYTGEYVFEANGKKQSIHWSLLMNDPMIVAQHTRKHIRKFQETQRVEDYKKAKAAATSAKTALTKAENAYKAAAAELEAAEQKAKKVEAAVNARLKAKLAAKKKSELVTV